MANLQINDRLAQRLQRLAERERQPVDVVLERLLDQFDPEPLLDAVPPEVEDKAAYMTALKEMRPKLYEKAREYWRRTGNQERLALTDRELDAQFWLIDPEGIPRLKSEQGHVQLPTDPLEALIGLVDEAPTDLSTSVRDTMAAHYKAKPDHDRSA